MGERTQLDELHRHLYLHVLLEITQGDRNRYICACELRHNVEEYHDLYAPVCCVLANIVGQK